MALVDLQEARAIEAERIKKALDELELQQKLQMSRIDAEMSRRGLQQSDARLQAILEARLERLHQLIQHRINIRKEMIRKCPELASVAELNALTESIHADVIKLQSEWQKCLIVPVDVFAEMHARVRDGVGAIKREIASQIPMKPKLPSLSVTISPIDTARADNHPSVQPAAMAAMPAGSIGEVSDVSRKLEEGLGDLKERNPHFAEALGQLGVAIRESKGLADKRVVYLEQIQFIAEQATRLPVLRRISVVKGLVVALHAGLSELPSISPALNHAVVLIESHFGLKGTSI